MKRLIAVALLLTAAYGTAMTAPLPGSWSGTWKLNPSRSYQPSPTYVIRMDGNGEYRMRVGTEDVTYRCDGKEYPMTPSTTHSCQQTGLSQMDSVNRRFGKVISKTHDELSDDGNTLTVRRTTFREDGTVETKNVTYARMVRGSGFAGAWKDTDPAHMAPGTMVTRLSGSTLRISFPEEKQVTDIPLNGTDAPARGLPAGVNMTISAKVDGPLRILTERKLDGKVLNEGDMMLSPDGRTLRQRAWRADTPKRATIMVYDRQ